MYSICYIAFILGRNLIDLDLFLCIDFNYIEILSLVTISLLSNIHTCPSIKAVCDNIAQSASLLAKLLSTCLVIFSVLNFWKNATVAKLVSYLQLTHSYIGCM